MKLKKLIMLVCFSAWAFVTIEAQTATAPLKYVYSLAKAEVSTGLILSGCTCSKDANVLWKSTINDLSSTERKKLSPLVKPSKTAIYSLYVITGTSGAEVLTEIHTVVVIDIKISTKEKNVSKVMDSRPITFLGELVNVGSLNILPASPDPLSIVQSWELKGVTSGTPSKTKTYAVPSMVSMVDKMIQTENDNSNTDLIDVWNFSYSVKLKGKNCTGESSRTVTSSPIVIQVYKFWITQFRDAASDKDWKVVVGKDIERKTNSTSDCTNFMWEMPDLMAGSTTEPVWHLNTTTGLFGATFSQIPIQDLQQRPLSLDNARVKNADFGDKNGTVRVACVDGAGNMHVVYSRNPPAGSRAISPQQVAKVYFQRDLDLTGNDTEITSITTVANPKKPLWFIFWKEGNVVDLLHDAEYFNDNRQLYGLTFRNPSGIAIVNINSRSIRHVVQNFSIREIGSRTSFTYGSAGNHAQSLIGCLIHENYHKSVLDAPTWGAIKNFRPGIESDGDAIPDAEENVPGTEGYPGSAEFPRSKPARGNADTYDLAGTVEAGNPLSGLLDYGDQDLRCRLLQYKNTSTDAWRVHYNVNIDWSAISYNTNW